MPVAGSSYPAGQEGYRKLAITARFAAEAGES
jgi:hypothetical protein